MPAKKKFIEQVAEVMATGAETPADVAPPPSGTRVVTAEDLAADTAFLDNEAPQQPLGDGPADMPEATATEEPEADTQQSSRGSVTALIKALLADPDLRCEAIVLRVKVDHPTARSVASTASVRRKKGVAVPMRRPSAGPSAD